MKLNRKKTIFSSLLFGLCILAIYVLLINVDFTHRWESHHCFVFTNWPGEGMSGLCEYPVLRGSKGVMVLPSRAMIMGDSGVIDGTYTLYQAQGPFKSLKGAEYPYSAGRIVGVATFWDEHGKVVRQERWVADRPLSVGERWIPSDEDIAEEKTSPPWWNDAQDQVPPDGVYTELYQIVEQAYVNKQWRYKNGKIVETRTAPPWLEPDPGFWKFNSGILVFFPGMGDSRYRLNGKPVANGQVLQIHEGPRVRVKFSDDDKFPHARYVLSEKFEGMPAGRGVVLRGTGSLEWP